MRKGAAWVAVVAAVAGVVLSGVALHHYYHLLKGGLEQPSFCNLSEQWNCDLVTTSSYATLFGQPVAGLGVLYFLLQAVFGLFAATGGIGAERRPTAAFAGLLSVIALGYPAYLAYVMAAKLHTVCLTCLGVDLAAVLLAIAWGAALHGSLGERWRWATTRWRSHAAVASLIVGVGLIFVASASQAAYEAMKQPRWSRAKLAEAVAAYQKGSLFDLRPDPADHPVWGNPNAKVTVVEFSDFQCPFCRTAAFELKAALAEFREQVRLIFLNYPLDSTCNSAIERSFHPVACLAARATKCAQAEGRFWEYHDDLFRNQQKLSRELMVTLAKTHGLGEPAFSQCLDAAATDAAVKADVAIGQHVHIQGTPTVLINNRQVQNWRSRDLVRAIIRAELAR